MKNYFYFLVFLLFNGEVFAQSTTISPDRVSVPKMTTAVKNALPNKTEGMMVYDSNLQQFSYWTGTTWTNFGSTGIANTGWQQNGTKVSTTNGNEASNFYAISPNAQIPDGTGSDMCGATLTSTLSVPLSKIITDTDEFVLTLKINHTFSKDLKIDLQLPTGEIIRILDRPATFTGDFIVANPISFNSSAISQLSVANVVGGVVQAGKYLPSGTLPGSLSTLIGKQVQGNWNLILQDCSTTDIGTLVAWSISLNDDFVGNVGIGTSSPQEKLEVNGGIKTKYSGTLIQTTTGAGLQTLNFTIPTVPVGWDFTNTVVLMSVADGGSGSIDQAKLLNSTTIQARQNVSAAGATRYNYIIFRL